LIKKSGLLLARHTGRRTPRAHGTIMTSRSNERWCSDALEFTCWNGWTAMTARSSAGWPQRPGSPAR
jgi:hypothetical protein